MKARTIWEPWASLIILGHKRFETVPGRFHHRGDLLIHAAKRWTPMQREICQWPFFQACLPEDFEPQLGKVLGRVQLVNCVPTVWVSPGLSDQELAFGDYTLGRFALSLQDPEAFSEPIPYRGQQGLFNIDRREVGL